MAKSIHLFQNEVFEACFRVKKELYRDMYRTHKLHHLWAVKTGPFSRIITNKMAS